MEEFKAQLSEDTRDFWVNPQITYLHNPTPLEFLQEAVLSYHPVIITGLLDDWPALSKWDINYIVENLGEDTLIPINLTSDGLADAVKSIDNIETFVYPCELQLKLKIFREMMLSPHYFDAVPYLSQQNNNFQTTFQTLHKDIPSSLLLADESFKNYQLEATNLWIGDERSISSLHKDYFENFYCVINGEKTFTLFPPTDILYFPEIEVPTAKYTIDSTTIDFDKRILANQLNLELNLKNNLNLNNNETIANDNNETNNNFEANITETNEYEILSWISIDPNIKETYFKYNSDMNLTTSIQCVVKSGEVLYIPAMWYHRVSQNCLTIAINYWYEQKFNYKYVFYKTIKNIKDLKLNNENLNKNELES